VDARASGAVGAGGGAIGGRADRAGDVDAGASAAGLPLVSGDHAAEPALRGGEAEAACQRALQVDAVSYRSVRSILQMGLERQEVPAGEPPAALPQEHENLRGSSYYGGEEWPC